LSTHKKYTPFGFDQQQDNKQSNQHDTIPQKYANPQPTSIQIQPPTKWMNQTWQQTITDPTKINARHLQSKGTNEGLPTHLHGSKANATQDGNN
jgi:hypothetical protein